MHPTRIAELLEPFLHSPTTTSSRDSELNAPRQSELNNPYHSQLNNPCHSEPGQRPGEEPAVLPPALDQRLTAHDLEHISTYIDILLRWNTRINLTAIRDPEDIVTRHFGESLFAARHLFPRGPHVETAAPGRPTEQSSAADDAAKSVGGREAMGGRAATGAGERAALQSLPRACRGGHVTSQKEAGALAPEGTVNDQRRSTNECPTNDCPTLADVGSGAGFPGLPIKLWAPQISLTLVESNHKKAAFLREVTRALTLTNVNIQNARAETLSTTFHVVTLRAVERFDAILPTAASLVAPTGRLALLISTAQQAQARSTVPNLAWSEPVPIPQSRSRILLVGHR
jgi:16S rRNA (guanine(527)-N(7))-methyltransferase RsmG